MDQITNTFIQKRLAQAPDAIKQAIIAAETETALKDIADKNDLHVDQLGALHQLATIVFLGIVDPDEVHDRLVEDVDLSKPQAIAVAKDLNAQVFQPIRDELKELLNTPLPDEAEQLAEEDAERANQPAEKTTLSAHIGPYQAALQAKEKTDNETSENEQVEETTRPRNIAKEKLGNTQHRSATQASAEANQPRTRRSHDPYREPIEPEDVNGDTPRQ